MVIETLDITNKKGKQAILISKKIRINDDKDYIKKVGNTLYVTPYHNPWQNLIDSTESFTADFMDKRNQPTQQQRELFDC